MAKYARTQVNYLGPLFRLFLCIVCKKIGKNEKLKS